jgi:hypothetical protein
MHSAERVVGEEVGVGVGNCVEQATGARVAGLAVGCEELTEDVGIWTGG